MKNANIVFGRNTVKFIGFRCIFGRSKSFFGLFSWLLLPSGWVRDSFGTWHEGRDYTTWEETLYHMEVDFAPQRAGFCTTKGRLHDSKIIPNEQQIGHVTLVGSEPKEI